MPQLDFPSTPSAGQVYSASNGVDYTWNATVGVWTAAPGTLLPDQTVATPGSLLYTDGTNSGWVDPFLYFVSYVTPPTASTDLGYPGAVAADSTYFYWFDSGSGQWLRVAGSTF